jgi:protocatechuate 3,4-dioxygenase beta subunit
MRRDLREDRAGTMLRLAIRVQDVDGCTPVRDAVVEVWHCDADGVYSGFDAGSGERFLRGAQVTDADGVVEFVTIYPGWYPGRAVHIHAKAHPDPTTVLTTQVYFDDSVTDAAFEAEPYAARGERDTRNEGDGIFTGDNVLALSEQGDGYLGAITFGV